MFERHAFLGLALVATGLVAGTATVLAGDAETPTTLHAPGARHAHRAVPVVIERRDALRRVDRLLEGLRTLERLAEERREVVTVEIRGRHFLRGESAPGRGKSHDDAQPLRTRGGETLGHRHDGAADDFSRQVRKMTRDLAALHDTLRDAPLARPAPIVVIEAVGEREFRDFFHAVRRPRWDDDRLHVLRDIVKHHHFTAAQAAQIIEHGFRFERLDAALVLYPRVIDKDHSYRLYEALRWDTDRDALRRAIRAMER